MTENWELHSGCKAKGFSYMEEEIWGADTALELSKFSWKLEAGISKILFKENTALNERRAQSEK